MDFDLEEARAALAEILEREIHPIAPAA